MYFSRKLVASGVVLISMQAALIGGASAAAKPTPAAKRRSHIQTPPHVYLPPVNNASAKKAAPARPTNSSASQAATLKARAAPELSERRVAIDPSQVQTRIKQSRRSELQSVHQRAQYRFPGKAIPIAANSASRVVTPQTESGCPECPRALITARP